MTKIRSQTKKQLLLLLTAGLAIGLTRSGKKQYLILKSIPNELAKIRRGELYRIIKQFRNDRLINYIEKPNGNIKIELSDQGKRRALEFDVDKIVLKRPQKWDRRWRLVIFDIPETKKRARNALRLKLRELGFIEWQKSVFVFPYPCRDEIDFVVEFFNLRNYVRFAELLDPTNEEELLLHFDLTK